MNRTFWGFDNISCRSENSIDMFLELSLLSFLGVSPPRQMFFEERITALI